MTISPVKFDVSFLSVKNPFFNPAKLQINLKNVNSVIKRLISDQIALHSAQLPLYVVANFNLKDSLFRDALTVVVGDGRVLSKYDLFH